MTMDLTASISNLALGKAIIIIIIDFVKSN